MNGRTETRRLSAAQMARYADWFENAKRLRALTSELEALSLDLARSSEDWGPSGTRVRSSGTTRSSRASV